MNDNRLTFDPERHAYTLDGKPMPSVTQIIGAAGLSDFSNVNTEVFAAACKFGKHAHLALEVYDKGTLDESSLSPALVPILEAWKGFRLEMGATMVAIEMPVASPKWQYAGTLDRVFLSNNRLWLLDIKTATADAPETALQTAAYEKAFLEWFPLDVKKPIKRASVRLGLNGKFQITKHESKTDFNVFLACLNIWRWKKTHNLIKEQ